MHLLARENFSGTDTFTYKPGGADDATAETVTITVNPVNDAPVALDDEYGVTSVRVVTAPGVLSNDTDAEDDRITAIKLTDPDHGTLLLNTDGSFTYTPEAGFTGPDSFTYKANDGTDDSEAATVTINVEPVVGP